MTTKFNVTGMTCSACSAHVEKAVAKVEGVTSVNVSLLTNSMVCEHVCDAQNIVNAVEHAGYGATVVGKDAPTSTQKPKSKLNDGQITLGRVIASLALCLVLMYVAMGHMVGLPLPSFLDGAQNATNFALAQLLLCLPVWYLNRSYFIVGFKRLFSRAPNMDSLIAVGSAAGAIYGVIIMFMVGSAIGRGDMAMVEMYHHQLYFESSAMILALVNLGKYLENISKRKTGNALTKLKNLAPQSAILLVDGNELTVDSKSVKVGDVVVVKAGMTVPSDGKIIQGSCFVDQSALTGEPIPAEKQVGASVVGGTINCSGYVQVEVTTVG
ncbi:MAG: heavy metal translocating P-type ATPase, partial [Clostridia bacterium]|nr:heavy metal translocating P-type ATPase [Clostridia bacterium]